MARTFAGLVVVDSPSFGQSVFVCSLHSQTPANLPSLLSSHFKFKFIGRNSSAAAAVSVKCEGEEEEEEENMMKNVTTLVWKVRVWAVCSLPVCVCFLSLSLFRLVSVGFPFSAANEQTHTFRTPAQKTFEQHLNDFEERVRE